MCDGELPAADRRCQANREHHHADAVVEQALAADLGFELRRHPCRLQDAEHGDRIGRADQCAEHQAPDHRQVESEHRCHELEAEADDEGRDDHAEQRHRHHCKASLHQHVEIDVQGAGEQEEGQHRIQEDVIEVDVMKEGAYRIADAEAGDGRVERDHDKGGDGAHHGEPDGVRHA